ncbi:MAG: hypothetical protein PHF08_09470 [Candidatus Riflebacteria bacterium]|nr:hypothetical protein [Candidatus Riflebacteria bacterium]
MNLRNLKNFPGTQKAIKQAKKSLPWPTSEMPGVPELVGHITNIIREDNAIYFNVEVADNSVQNYPAELTKAGFCGRTLLRWALPRKKKCKQR